MRVLRRRLAGLVSLAVPLSLAVTPTPAQAVAYPSVVITAPSANASVAGTTAITFNAALDPAGSATISTFQLVVDGTPYGGTLGCPGGAVKSCSQQLLWEATGSGSHSLQVRMKSSTAATTDSAAVTVMVTHPHATVSISSPVAGATVSGAYLEAAADGVLDNPDTDQVQTMSLLVDSLHVSLQVCGNWSSSTSDCPVYFGWDSTTLAPGSHTLQAELTTRSGGVWDSPPVTVTVVAYVDPTVTVGTGPAAGSVVHGTVSVTATGIVHSPGDHTQSLDLLVDGGLVDWFDCDLGSTTCTGTMQWTTGTVAGVHTIGVAVETDQGYVESAPVTVNVASTPTTPPTGPAFWTYFSTGPSNQPVYGPLVLLVEGRVDPRSAARAIDEQLYVDHQPSGQPIMCPVTSPRECDVSVPWQTRGLVGTHVVQMAFDTTAGTVMSEQQTYDVEPYAAGSTSVYVTAHAEGGHEVVSGRIGSRTSALPGAPVNITVTRGADNPTTYLATSDASGNFTLDVGKPFAVTSTITASLPADYGSATSSYVQEAYVTLACHLPKKIVHGKKTTVTCTTTPAARNGGKVTLYFKYLHAGYHVLGHGIVKNGKVTITFTTKVRSPKVQLWAKLSRTKTAAPAYTRTIFARMV